MVAFVRIRRYIFWKAFNSLFDRSHFSFSSPVNVFFVSSFSNPLFFNRILIFSNSNYWNMIRITFFSKRLFFYRAFAFKNFRVLQFVLNNKKNF